MPHAMIDPALIPLIQRLDRDPEDDDALDAIREALLHQGDVSMFARLAEKVAARRKDPKRGADAISLAADAWAYGARDDHAVPLWRQALEVDPQHVGANLGLAGAMRRAGQLDQAEAAYVRLLDVVRGEARRIPILNDLAGLRAERGDLNGEISALREVVSLHGAGSAATESRRTLARLLVQRSRARERAEGEGESFDDDTKEAARTLAAIAREGATGRALDFAQAALALWPGEERAFQMLVASTLKHADSVTMRIRFLAANPESEIAVRVRGELADAYVAMGRVDDAVTVLAAFASEDAESARQLTRIYERTGRHADLARLLAMLPVPDDRRERLLLHRRRAAVARTLGDRAGVIENLERVLDDAPADPEALHDVERDLRVKGALEALRDRLRAAARDEAAPASSRVRWWREVAQLSERRFDAPEEALDAWRAVLRAAEEPDDLRDAGEGVERALERLERWTELADARTATARAAQGDDDRRAAWLRWLEVAEARLSPEGLLRGLGEALRAAPCDELRAAVVKARRGVGDAAGVTEAMRTRAEAATGADGAVAWSELASHLEAEGESDAALEAWRKARSLDASLEDAWQGEARIYESRGDRESQFETLLAQANHPTAAGRSAGALYGRATEIAYDLGRDEEARALAERALRFNPGDEAMQAVLTALRSEDTAPVPVVVDAESPPEADEEIEAVDDVELQEIDEVDASPESEVEVTGEVAAPEPSRAADAVGEGTGELEPHDDAEATTAHEASGAGELDDAEATTAHEAPGAGELDDAEATTAHEVAAPHDHVASSSDDDGGPTGIMNRAALQQALEEAERAAAEELRADEPTPAPPPAAAPARPRSSLPPPPPPPPPLAPVAERTGTYEAVRPSEPERTTQPDGPPRSPPAPAIAPPPAEAEPSIIIDDGLLDGVAAPQPERSTLTPPGLPPIPSLPPVLGPAARPPLPSVAPPVPRPSRPPPAPPAPSVQPLPMAPAPPSLQPLAMAPPPAPSLQPLAMAPPPPSLQPLAMAPPPAPSLQPLAMASPPPSLQPLAMNPLQAAPASLQPLSMGAPPLEPLSMGAPPPAALPSLEMRPVEQSPDQGLSMPYDDPPHDENAFDDPFAQPSDPFAVAPPQALVPQAAPAAPVYERVMLAMLERALGHRGG